MVDGDRLYMVRRAFGGTCPFGLEKPGNMGAGRYALLRMLQNQAVSQSDAAMGEMGGFSLSKAFKKIGAKIKKDLKRIEKQLKSPQTKAILGTVLTIAGGAAGAAAVAAVAAADKKKQEEKAAAVAAKAAAEAAAKQAAAEAAAKQAAAEAAARAVGPVIVGPAPPGTQPTAQPWMVTSPARKSGAMTWVLLGSGAVALVLAGIVAFRK